MNTIATGPFKAKQSSDGWIIVGEDGRILATVHGEYAYHDAPLLTRAINEYPELSDSVPELELKCEALEDDNITAAYKIEVLEGNISRLEMDIDQLRRKE